MVIIKLLLLICLLIPWPQAASAQVLRSDSKSADKISSPEDRLQAEQLLLEAEQLFRAGQPIDARAKLQHALQLAPDDYRVYKMLGTYYLIQVAHFRLAYSYLTKTKELFNKKFGSDLDGSLAPETWREHAEILHLVAEAQLNLDRYEESLSTLDLYKSLYWAEWLPGSYAWVLYKLDRVEEAIQVAQEGLMQGAQASRTLNILGILFSVSNQRLLALEAFGKAIRTELAMGSFGEPSTPLNNAGEVYREMFEDEKAEAAWIKALQFPDGCQHILPSLNLANLYIEQLRLFQAERVLSDFEVCFAQDPLRQDTEHRSLLALARGRIALHEGDPKNAIKFLEQASEREQWYGKIGTNPIDLNFAAITSLATALKAHANNITQTSATSIADKAQLMFERTKLKIRALWLRRKARLLSLEKLHGFKDIEIRSTDTMLEYPTLTAIIAELPSRSLNRRLARIEEQDPRPIAHAYYDLYRASASKQAGDLDQAERLLKAALNRLRELDRLTRATALTLLIEVRSQQTERFLFSRKPEATSELAQLKQELFLLQPAALRNANISLPISAISHDGSSIAKKLSAHLTNTAFAIYDASAFGIEITPKANTITLSLKLKQTGQIVARTESTIETKDEQAQLINRFLDEVFKHRVDPPPVPNAQTEIWSELLQ